MLSQAVFVLKKRLLHFIVYNEEPVLRGSGPLTKVIGLGLKFAGPLLNSA